MSCLLVKLPKVLAATNLETKLIKYIGIKIPTFFQITLTGNL
ncbi:hypothetical protein SLEP1_g30635 [Rubroshorea leprosula]|uniref:Uncharacterized protein n=1 Tax=Rubroshorea leprosula TaxID=152421 RepID=A0AAV5K8Z2_9ROSI|nr:hypothetical protein SLEP1_g30635 [Rubroshorea leprosula]